MASYSVMLNPELPRGRGPRRPAAPRFAGTSSRLRPPRLDMSMVSGPGPAAALPPGAVPSPGLALTDACFLLHKQRRAWERRSFIPPEDSPCLARGISLNIWDAFCQDRDSH